MAVREVAFSQEAALESLLYIAAKVQGLDIHRALKIRYEADKLHLSRYGWMASGDRYVAMRYGPVASETYRLLQTVRGDAPDGLAAPNIDAIRESIDVVERDRIVAKRGPDTDALSASDVECLDAAIEADRPLDFQARTAKSHDAAYDDAWALAQKGKRGQAHMPVRSIARCLPNAEEILGTLDH